MRTTPAPSAQRVAIISANPETLDGLQGYLRGVGMDARGTRRLADCCALTTPATVAAVLFPDDFPAERVFATVSDLAAQRPNLLRVLVTGHPKTFEGLVEGRLPPLIVPRPAWGWMILDAIREHIDRDASRRLPRGGAR